MPCTGGIGLDSQLQGQKPRQQFACLHGWARFRTGMPPAAATTVLQTGLERGAWGGVPAACRIDGAASRAEGRDSEYA